MARTVMMVRGTGDSIGASQMGTEFFGEEHAAYRSEGG
jgi:hypothetical protein